MKPAALAGGWLDRRESLDLDPDLGRERREPLDRERERERRDPDLERERREPLDLGRGRREPLDLERERRGLAWAMTWRTPLTDALVPPGDKIAETDPPVPPSSSAQGGLHDGLNSTSSTLFLAPFFLDRERRVAAAADAASAAAASFRLCAAAAAATSASCAERFAAWSFGLGLGTFDLHQQQVQKNKNVLCIILSDLGLGS